MELNRRLPKWPFIRVMEYVLKSIRVTIVGHIQNDKYSDFCLFKTSLRCIDNKLLSVCVQLQLSDH